MPAKTAATLFSRANMLTSKALPRPAGRPWSSTAYLSRKFWAATSTAQPSSPSSSTSPDSGSAESSPSAPLAKLVEHQPLKTWVRQLPTRVVTAWQRLWAWCKSMMTRNTRWGEGASQERNRESLRATLPALPPVVLPKELLPLKTPSGKDSPMDKTEFLKLVLAKMRQQEALRIELENTPKYDESREEWTMPSGKKFTNEELDKHKAEDKASLDPELLALYRFLKQVKKGEKKPLQTKKGLDGLEEAEAELKKDAKAEKSKYSLKEMELEIRKKAIQKAYEEMLKAKAESVPEEAKEAGEHGGLGGIPSPMPATPRPGGRPEDSLSQWGNLLKSMSGQPIPVKIKGTIHQTNAAELMEMLEEQDRDKLASLWAVVRNCDKEARHGFLENLWAQMEQRAPFLYERAMKEAGL